MPNSVTATDVFLIQVGLIGALLIMIAYAVVAIMMGWHKSNERHRFGQTSDCE